MKAVTKRNDWTEFLKLFSKQNNLRPTRLAVFEGKPGGIRDYWLEDDLLLTGVDIDTHKKGEPTIEIMLSKDESVDSHVMTHVIRGAKSAKIILGFDGKDNGLEIKDLNGDTTYLRFEN